MTPRLNPGVLARIPAAVRRPDYDFLNSSIGIVHLGLGAFHRAHQALYTEDALRSSGGVLGLIRASIAHPAAADDFGGRKKIDSGGDPRGNFRYLIRAFVQPF